MQAPLTIQVDYSLHAYRSLTTERWVDAMAEVSAKVGRPVNRWERAVSLAFWQLVVTVVWAVKRFRVGRCIFHLDAEGVTRNSARMGALHAPWSRFRRVQALPSGWLLHTDRGAIALPKECVSAAQEEALIALVPPALWSAPT
ncbi:MAG: YcxB family protein [Inhella sp.]|jgi:hypothetical protein|uniref:YcxB family protein n=1 Tax=Inhella sp. TaxID=1921806 RepID=UPI0022CAA100|nr:YcxB family protein [Inhella sp.]MCZ8234105.1 YcxB family protein [Inhella sp.]